MGQGSGIAVSCGIGRTHGPDLMLWLWCRLAAAAPIRPVAWETPYAMGVALKKKRQKNNIEHLPSGQGGAVEQHRCGSALCPCGDFIEIGMTDQRRLNPSMACRQRLSPDDCKES